MEAEILQSLIYLLRKAAVASLWDLFARVGESEMDHVQLDEGRVHAMPCRAMQSRAEPCASKTMPRCIAFLPDGKKRTTAMLDIYHNLLSS